MNHYRVPYFLFTVQCGTRGDGTNSCNVVDGGLSIFIDGAPSDEEQTILATLKQGMDDNEFNSAHPGIIRVTMIDLSAVNPAQEDEGNGAAPADTDKPPNRALIFSLIAGFTTILLALAAFAWRRRQKEEEAAEDASNSLQPSDFDPEGVEL